MIIQNFPKVDRQTKIIASVSFHQVFEENVEIFFFFKGKYVCVCRERREEPVPFQPQL